MVAALWTAWAVVRSCFGAIMEFCSKPPGSWIACAVAVSVGAWWFGQHEFNRGVASVAVKQAPFVARRVAAQDKITLNIGDIVVAGTIGAVTDTGRRQSEIPTHVTPQIDAAYPVPLGFVRVWNDASHGPIPDSAAGADESPSGVPLSDVAGAHVADEGTLDICRVRLTGWQDWYKQQKALSEKSN